jgi:hypothetical protein
MRLIDMRALKTIALTAALSSCWLGNARADDIDALLLGGYWCSSEDKTKTESIPRNRTFLLTRQVEAPNTAADTTFTEHLVDVTGDVRGQRIVLLQKLKNADGTACKTDCLLARRLVHKDMLEAGEWNSTTGVFKSNNPREYIYRCDK